jgi:hypothetical protein
LQQSFEQWGLPKSIKVDNGKPFGDPQRSSVPVLALWLIGLGVEVIWNPPRSPRANAKVERMQGTTSRWVEIEQCLSYEHLQDKLNQVAKLQREQYEVRRLGGQSRKEYYPQLWTNTRHYDKEAFEVRKVYAYLKEVAFVRKVNQRGAFNFYAHKVYLGPAHRNKTISLRYSIPDNSFIITDQSNTNIASLKADNFTKEYLISLSVCQNKYVKCCNFMSPPTR